MKRIIYMVLMNLLHAPMWFFTIARMAREEDTRTAAEKYGYISEMVKRINRRGRVTVTATGTEHIPSQDGFILFPNHQAPVRYACPVFNLPKTAVCCNKEKRHPTGFW